MLPATPTTSSPFPSKGGVGRGGGYNESAVLAGPIAFAKRKKSVFKGPMLNGSSNSNKRDSMGSMSSKPRGGGNGGIIEEEEEDEEEVVDFGLDDDDIIIVDESEDKSDDDLPVRRAVSH